MEWCLIILSKKQTTSGTERFQCIDKHVMVLWAKDKDKDKQITSLGCGSSSTPVSPRTRGVCTLVAQVPVF